MNQIEREVLEKKNVLKGLRRDRAHCFYDWDIIISRRVWLGIYPHSLPHLSTLVRREISRFLEDRVENHMQRG